MKIVKARKRKQCKKCQKDIWCGELYCPQRRKKALCLSCGKSGGVTFLAKLLNWLGGHGE